MPLWHALSSSPLTTGLLSGIALPSPFRNGSKTRDSVPLWHALSSSPLTTGLLSGIALPSPFRNGSKTRDSVPLWHVEARQYMWTKSILLSPYPA